MFCDFQSYTVAVICLISLFIILSHCLKLYFFIGSSSLLFLPFFYHPFSLSRFCLHLAQNSPRHNLSVLFLFFFVIPLTKVEFKAPTSLLIFCTHFLNFYFSVPLSFIVRPRYLNSLTLTLYAVLSDKTFHFNFQKYNKFFFPIIHQVFCLM